jgi:hypothetical protein
MFLHLLLCSLHLPRREWGAHACKTEKDVEENKRKREGKGGQRTTS